MAFHHVAFASRDLESTHRFYTEAMGFSLVKLVAGPTPEGGWAKHAFYATDDDGGESGMIAFWDLHVESLRDFPTDHNESIGLPGWVNHVAFDAPSLEVLEAHRRRWQEQGMTVVEVNHGFCTSIYTSDPNGITVEFCCTTRAFTDEEWQWAATNLLESDVELEPMPDAVFHEPLAAAPA